MSFVMLLSWLLCSIITGWDLALVPQAVSWSVQNKEL